jgi:hypothetical protein
MDKIKKNRHSAVAISMMATLVAGALLISALFAAGTASAQDKGSGVTQQAPATVTPTPRPIRLRPWVQFGHARPGGTATYHKLLFNHLTQDTPVDLSGGSLRGWDVSVDPTNTIAMPGYANIITITVGVPENPAHWVDIERARATISETEPFTTTAYMITITRRHPFADVNEGDWADDPIQYLVDQNVMTGYADGTFRPNENVTRAQFAKMLVVAMGWPIQTPSTPTFSDVPASDWAYGYVETAAAHGVISGYGDGTFRPSASITRAQLAKMIFTARAWVMQSPTFTGFSDVSNGDWYYNYVQGLSSAEAISGYTDHSFRPNAPATRAQVAKILALSLFSDPNN